MFFISFSCRKMLEEMYYKWLEQEEHLSDTPFNVICFLYTRNLLNEEKTKQLWGKYRKLKKQNGEEYSIEELLK